MYLCCFHCFRLSSCQTIITSLREDPWKVNQEIGLNKDAWTPFFLLPHCFSLDYQVLSVQMRLTTLRCRGSWFFFFLISEYICTEEKCIILCKILFQLHIGMFIQDLDTSHCKWWEGKFEKHYKKVTLFTHKIFIYI